jgi:peptide/nickel transport system permease protein
MMSLSRLNSSFGIVGFIIMAMFVVMGVTAPWLAPFDPMALNYLPSGQLARLSPPQAPHYLGTTYFGRDVLSQIIHGAGVSLTIGLAGAAITVAVGFNIGLIAGYSGGRTDAFLMRLTDIAFGIPFLPFTILLVALLQPSVWNIVFTISCLQWRSAARVLRAQVLSLKHRPYIRAAQVAGAGHWRIMYRHIAPALMPLTLLYIAFGVAYSVLAEASISFLGFGDPVRVTWGGMLHDAYITGSLNRAWWQVVPAGLCITALVLSSFMIAREFERAVDPRLQ